MATPVLSRRAYLVIRLMETGASMALATEAVASLAIEHPELDLEERRTWWEWAQQEEG